MASHTAHTDPADQAVRDRAAVEVFVDPGELRVLVCDADGPVGYELWFREGRGRAAGPGWLELTHRHGGGVCRVAVPTAEVMAVAREDGAEEQVALMTERLAGLFEQGGCARSRSIARRLRDEVQGGRNLERVSLRALQARIVELLVEGETIVTLCERGGFTYRGGRPDTTWFERRAGLVSERCSRTGKVRRRRTASYEVFCQLVRAVDGSPHEFGV